jgi:8-oxo-dGTP diphosphatase
MENLKPALTSDVVVINISGEKAKVLLIKRKNEPYAGLWAIPGGFVEKDEAAEKAAERELYEETSLKCNDFKLIDIFSKKGRDPRGWVVTSAYLCIVKEEPFVKAGDDAREAEWFCLDKLPKLAFDHDEILMKAFNMIKQLAKDALYRLSFFPSATEISDFEELI